MYNFTFLLPTRKKVSLVYRLFDSIVTTTGDLSKLEIILGIDEDDKESKQIRDDRLNIKKIYFPTEKKYTLSALFEECFKASSGRFVQMMNDDVVLKTKNWDNRLLDASKVYPDDVVLFQVNDLQGSNTLACHPIVSRRACLKIGFTDIDYKRYAPDDHIYDVYNILFYLGFKRILFLKDVIFHHIHDKIDENGKRVSIYPNVEHFKIDLRLFESKTKQDYRKSLALKLASLIAPDLYQKNKTVYKNMLSTVEMYTRNKPTIHRIDKDSNIQDALGIIFTTENILSKKAKECLKTIKTYTSNYKLFIVEKTENYVKKINFYIENAKEEYIVIIDDTVKVKKGWFNNIKKSFDEKTALVAPAYMASKIRYSNFFFAGDNFIDHVYIPKTLDESAATERVAVRSSMLVLDMKKLKNKINVNKLYMKYYLGTDLSLKVWNAGYKVKESQDCIVDYIGKLNYPYNKTDHHIIRRDKALAISLIQQENPTATLESNRDYTKYKQIEDQLQNILSDKEIDEQILTDTLEKAKDIFEKPILKVIKERVSHIILNYLIKNQKNNKIYVILYNNLILHKSFSNRLLFYIKLFIYRKMYKYKIKDKIYDILFFIYNNFVPLRIKESFLVGKTLRYTLLPLLKRLGIIH